MQNKSRLFGPFSATLTLEDKNQLWDKIAKQISESYGTIRTRDDISKKWYNTLANFKPIIADKFATVRKTGVSAGEACLTELEAKTSSIKGNEAF